MFTEFDIVSFKVMQLLEMQQLLNSPSSLSKIWRIPYEGYQISFDTLHMSSD